MPKNASQNAKVYTQAQHEESERQLKLAYERIAAAENALQVLVEAVDVGFEGLAIRIPTPGQRRAIVSAADEAKRVLRA